MLPSWKLFVNKVKAYSWTDNFLYIWGTDSLVLNQKRISKECFGQMVFTQSFQMKRMFWINGFYTIISNECFGKTVFIQSFSLNILHLFQPGTGTMVLLTVTNRVLVCNGQHFLFAFICLLVLRTVNFMLWWMVMYMTWLLSLDCKFNICQNDTKEISQYTVTYEINILKALPTTCDINCCYFSNVTTICHHFWHMTIYIHTHRIHGCEETNRYSTDLQRNTETHKSYLLNTEHCGGGLQHNRALEVVKDLVGMLSNVKEGGHLQQLSQHIQRCAHKAAKLVAAAQVQRNLKPNVHTPFVTQHLPYQLQMSLSHSSPPANVFVTFLSTCQCLCHIP